MLFIGNRRLAWQRFPEADSRAKTQRREGKELGVVSQFAAADVRRRNSWDFEDLRLVTSAATLNMKF